MIKKQIKKTVWQRWKAKPIIDVKKKSLKDKQERVDDIVENLPKEIKKKEEKKWGRPTVMTKSVLDKLKTCFAVGMTDEQACYHCDISTDVLYKYQRKNPEFIKKKNVLKESITLHARVNIWKAIKSWSVQDSWQRVKIKDKDFMPKFKFEWEFKRVLTEDEKKFFRSLI